MTRPGLWASAERRPWLTLLLVAAVGVLARLAFAATLGDRFGDLSNDARSYRSIAENLVAGLGYIDTAHAESGPFTRPPLTPYFLALILSIWGDSLVIERAINALLGGAAAAASAYLAWSWFGRGAGVVAGLLTAVYPLFLVISATSLSENLGIPLAILAVLAGHRTLLSLRPWDAALTGVAVGLSMLNRSAMLVLLPALLLAFLARCGWRGARLWLVSAAVAGLVLLPWSTYASLANGRVVLVDTQGLLVLYFGNNPYFERSTLWQFHLGQPGASLVPEAAAPLVGLTDEERDRRALDLALGFIRAHPADAALYATQKLLLFWAWYPHPVDVFATVATLALALVGLARSFRRWQFLLLPLSLLVLLTLLHAATTALPRHRMTVMPLVFAFSGFGLMEMHRLVLQALPLRGRRGRSEGKGSPGR